MLDPQPLKGRTAIVTGSGQNIGEAIVKLFAKAGANVVVNGGSSQDKVDKVVADFMAEGGNAIRVTADVGDADAVDDIANACLYLAGETGGFITGEVLHVNGGQFRFQSSIAPTRSDPGHGMVIKQHK